MIGFSVKRAKGVGDVVQYTSLPENYFHATGRKLVDVDKWWCFDHNPYVERDVPARIVKDLWNFSPMQYHWPIPEGRPPVYRSNAELHAMVLGVINPILIRPRLYRFEDFPFENRRRILLHADGRSHGRLPRHIVNHVIEKYGPTGDLAIIGASDETYGLPKIETPTLWDLAEVLSKARMLIGCDSGPSWIAACFPDVVVKKVRTRPNAEQYVNWVPMEVKNFHSHWDDRIFRIYCDAERDVGPFESYRKL